MKEFKFNINDPVRVGWDRLGKWCHIINRVKSQSGDNLYYLSIHGGPHPEKLLTLKHPNKYDEFFKN